jgi:hypothetical protein
MIDWYTEGLGRMYNGHYWMCEYARYTGHFVDDFGNMVRVYAPDEQGIHHLMP